MNIEQKKEAIAERGSTLLVLMRTASQQIRGVLKKRGAHNEPGPKEFMDRHIVPMLREQPELFAQFVMLSLMMAANVDTMMTMEAEANGEK